MVEAIKHNAGTTVLTAGSETIKGAGIGILTTMLIGAVAATGLLMLGTWIAGLGALAAFTSGAVPLVASLIGIGLSSIASGITFGVPGAAIGGLVGLFRGGQRITREDAAYKNLANERQQEAALAVNDAHAAAQNGYMMGYQQGQQAVVSQLQQMQEQGGGFAAKIGQPATSKAEAIAKNREAQALAGPQIC